MCKVYQEILFIGSLWENSQTRQKHFKNNGLRSQGCFFKCIRTNKDFEDISENVDFFNELQASRSPYKPTLEDITEDEDDLFQLMSELEYPIPVDTNNNPLQKISG